MVNSPAFPGGCLWPEKVTHNELQVFGLPSDMICYAGIQWAYSVPFQFVIMIYLVLCVTTCTHECAHTTAQVWRSEDSLSYFSPSTTWVLGINLGSSGLAASNLPSERAQQYSLYIFYHYPNNSLQTM